MKICTPLKTKSVLFSRASVLPAALALGLVTVFAGTAPPALADAGVTKGVIFVANSGSSGSSSSGAGSSSSGSGSMGQSSPGMGPGSGSSSDSSTPGAMQRPTDCQPADPRPSCQVGALPETDQRGATPGGSSDPAAKDSPTTGSGSIDRSPGSSSGSSGSGSGSGSGSSGSGSGTGSSSRP